jgi:hypothetical protein
VAKWIFPSELQQEEQTPVVLMFILAPVIFGSLWLLRALRTQCAPGNARHAAIAFAISVLLVAGIGNVFGGLVGGYAELFFGTQFALPGVLLFTIVWTSFVTAGVALVWIGPRFIDEYRRTNQE